MCHVRFLFCLHYMQVPATETKRLTRVASAEETMPLAATAWACLTAWRSSTRVMSATVSTRAAKYVGNRKYVRYAMVYCVHTMSTLLNRTGLYGRA